MIRLLRILLEGRVEDFKKKYSVLPPDVQDEILKNDPSSNNKYLDWMGRVALTEPNLKLDTLIGDVEMSLKGMDKGKEAVHINNIQDVIYVFKNTGYEDRANYLSSVTGLKEVMKTYQPKARLL